MKLLDRFEQSMERLLEGSVGSIFRQKMQPAEIGTALERAMLDHRQISVGSVIVPNSYTVSLNPADFAQFAAYSQGLAHQMERLLFERATEEGAMVLDRIQVEIVEDAGARRGRPSVTCAITDMHRSPAAPRPGAQPPMRHQPAPAEATVPFRPRNARRQVFSLVGVDGVMRGSSLSLDRPSTSIGRAGDNALVIAASDVSRHHARIELIEGFPRLEDLGSTNGTQVNGQHVRHADLAAGDRIAFGSQVFDVIARVDGGSR